MLPKERLKSFVNYLGISENLFEKEAGLANGFFTGGRHISTNSISKIVNRYPDLNLNWLIAGIGNMTVSVKEEPDYSITIANEPNLNEKLRTAGKPSSDIEKIIELSLANSKSNMEITFTLKECIREKDALIEELKERIRRLEDRQQNMEKK